MKIRKGDKVRIIAGKYRWNFIADGEGGEMKKVPFEGTVAKVLNDKDAVIIEGANVVKRHLKKQGTNPGQIISIEKPIPISNIMLICPHTKEVTRVGIERKNGKKVRISKKASKPID